MAKGKRRSKIKREEIQTEVNSSQISKIPYSDQDADLQTGEEIMNKKLSQMYGISVRYPDTHTTILAAQKKQIRKDNRKYNKQFEATRKRLAEESKPRYLKIYEYLKKLVVRIFIAILIGLDMYKED